MLSASTTFLLTDPRVPGGLLAELLDAVRAGEPEPLPIAHRIYDALRDEGIAADHPSIPIDFVRQAREMAETIAAAAPLIASAGFDDEVARLATLRPVEYEQQRKASAERLGMRASALDRAVNAARSERATGQGAAVLFDEVEPAEVAVPLADLLASLSALFAQHVILPLYAADTAALWVAATWATDYTDCSPILLAKSPEPRCGKSTLLELLTKTTRRPLAVANVTPAALFRVIEQAAPTLLIDEGDAFLKGNEELRGVINAGHTRATAYVLRTVGDDHEPRRFNVYGFKALALIGKAPHTITDRSIVIELRRKLPSERVTKLRDTPKTTISTMCAGLARWAKDEAHKISSARPPIPDTLNDRAGDSWRPLLAVADLAGAEWSERARLAAVGLSSHVKEPAGTGVELLADVSQVFDQRGVDRIAGADLLAALLADEERPWATYNIGKPLSQAQLARRLSVFGIVSGAVRLPDGRNLKGYRREQFSDAFARYLASTPFQSVTGSQASNGAGCDGISNRHSENVCRFGRTSQASTGADRDGVTLSNPLNGDVDAGESL